jgi:hypothetical protein
LKERQSLAARIPVQVFFTKLKVKQVSKPIEANVIKDVCADIEGFDQPMLFLLFLHDGVIHTLEAPQ